MHPFAFLPYISEPLSQLETSSLPIILNLNLELSLYSSLYSN